MRSVRGRGGKRGRKLQRKRSERVERTFAHLCDTGGARRTWLRGLEKVQKRYKMAATAFNLGRILRSLLGAGKPRHLAVLAESFCFIHLVMRWYEKARRALQIALQSHEKENWLPSPAVA